MTYKIIDVTKLHNWKSMVVRIIAYMKLSMEKVDT